ncbi:Pyruvate/Phosphoenolpyruvate kinase-like domain-containing protein [Scenedesmus sp. NREL 46B-D3]|nr:Pyruvate/Phosphoenolpyruvate kinase-like domain-containing protein [Scenedesmus sp. NREL 46B-D3]
MVPWCSTWRLLARVRRQLLEAPADCWHNVGTRAYLAAAVHHHPHQYPPRRAMLYVPGTAERKLRKAATEISVDSIVMDCEDGVALNMKDVARATIATMLDDPHYRPTGEAAVRINPVSSGMAADDLAAVLSCKRLPGALVVPKVEGPEEVHWLMDRAQQLLAKQPQRQQLVKASSAGSDSVHAQQRALALVTMCESALALLDLR